MVEHFSDPSVQKSIEVDVTLIDQYDALVNDLEPTIVREAKRLFNTFTANSAWDPVPLERPWKPQSESESDARVKIIPGVTGVSVKVVWEPTWNPSMMSEAAKLELGF